MKAVSRVALLAIFATMFAQSVQASLPQTDSEGRELPSLSSMLKQVNPAVVNIATFSERQQAQNPLLNDPFFRRFFNIPDQPRQEERPKKRQMAAGSGVIVDAEKGLVITNNHVVKDSDEVRVSLVDGRHFTAKILGTDPDLDIAVLKIDADKLTAVKIGNSEQLEVGDFVVAIGNPFALGQTVTTGIVSALGRSGLGIEGYENFIQTDASINPGNSGGALVDLHGNLIGINTAILAPAGGNVGIGFAIPADMVKASMDQIVDDGEVKRGQIGVNPQEITVDLQIAMNLKNGQQGVLIANVAEDSPAEKAGLKYEDIIVEVDGHPVTSNGQLRSQIGKHKIGDEVAIKVLRDGNFKTFDVKVGEPQNEGTNGSMHPALEGVELQNNEEGNGVVVSDLDQYSAAAYKGLRPGDVIVGANRMRVSNLKDLSKAIKKDDKKVLLRVRRGSVAFYLVLP